MAKEIGLVLLRLLLRAHAARRSGRFSTRAVAPALPPCVPAACDRRFASFATRALRQRGARSTPGGGRSSLSSWMRGPSSACRQRSLQHDLARAMRLHDGESGTLTSFSVLLMQSDRSVPVIRDVFNHDNAHYRCRPALSTRTVAALWRGPWGRAVARSWAARCRETPLGQTERERERERAALGRGGREQLSRGQRTWSVPDPPFHRLTGFSMPGIE